MSFIIQTRPLRNTQYRVNFVINGEPHSHDPRHRPDTGHGRPERSPTSLTTSKPSCRHGQRMVRAGSDATACGMVLEMNTRISVPLSKNRASVWRSAREPRRVDPDRDQRSDRDDVAGRASIVPNPMIAAAISTLRTSAAIPANGGIVSLPAPEIRLPWHTLRLRTNDGSSS